ncbi:aspartyl protease family protein [Bradyrhizobium sp. USDA 4341]
MTFGRLSAVALTLRSSFSPKWQPRAAALARGGAAGVVKLRVRFSEYGVMRNLMIFAAILIGLGTFMAQMASKMSPAAATTAKQTMAPAVTVAQASARTLSIAPDPRGHFATDGRIDGQRINFMVDTGASVVALNETSAARFGLRPVPGDYTSRVTTANGTIKAARARLAMIEIGGLTVRDVDALVLPDEALSENLLGLSFLSKLKRFEYANGKLLLEQ